MRQQRGQRRHLRDTVTSDLDAPPAVPPARRTLKQRLAANFAAYGRIAIITYLSLSLLTIAGFSLAIGVGAEPSSATGVLGVIGAGWLAAKATMPVHLGGTAGGGSPPPKGHEAGRGRRARA
jgi:hypothetical protein